MPGSDAFGLASRNDRRNLFRFRFIQPANGREGKQSGCVSPDEQFLQRADGLCLATDRTMRPLVRVPGEDVEMRPGTGVLDEALEEERGGDGTCKAVGRHVVDVRELRGELGIVR